MKTGYETILSSQSRRLYIGGTSDLEVRIWERKQGRSEDFTKSDEINKLVYYEIYPAMMGAIAREKQWKGWSRAKRIALILEKNPAWEELSLH